MYLWCITESTEPTENGILRFYMQYWVGIRRIVGLEQAAKGRALMVARRTYQIEHHGLCNSSEIKSDI